MRVACPKCGFSFDVEDIHRPLRCPRCASVFDLAPPDFSPRLLIDGDEIDER